MEPRQYEGNAAGSPPSVPPSPSVGYPTSSNPSTGVQATKPGPYWYYMIGESLRRVLVRAGVTPSANNLDLFVESIERLIDAQSGNYALDTGAANAYVVALDPAVAAYGDGMTVRFKVANANTGASTLNAGGGVAPLVNDVGGALAAGDLPAGNVLEATYIASEGKFFITSMVQSQGDARYVSQSSMVGAIEYFAMSSAPTGWIKANGALISRATYANLFAAIGTTYGAGDGATTFALPDLRGEFLRGWDDGRGIDADRLFGSSQLDAFQGHRHDMGITMTGTSGSTQQSPNSGGGNYSAVFGATTDGLNGAPRVSAETRPRNVALLACIKY